MPFPRLWIIHRSVTKHPRSWWSLVLNARHWLNIICVLTLDAAGCLWALAAWLWPVIYGSSFGWHFPLVQLSSQLALQYFLYTFSCTVACSRRNCVQVRARATNAVFQPFVLQGFSVAEDTVVAKRYYKDLNSMWCKEGHLPTLMALILLGA